MIRSIAGVVAALALTGVIAGCGTGSATPGPPVRTTSVDLPASYKFAPADIVVSKGATVTWTNSDNFSHSVQFKDGGLPTEPMVMGVGGAPVTFTFDTPGVYHYQCSFHPTNMQGSVTVEP
jgi:plastocyanin